MHKNNYTMFSWFIILILGILSVVTMGTIIGIIAGIVTIISAIIVAPRTYKNVKSWWLLRNPIKITYLIPQSQYERKQFKGAPTQEIKPGNLTIGIGKYQLFILFTPKITLTPSYPPYIQSVGADKNKPKLFVLDNHPFVVEETHDAYGNISSRTDWHGVTTKGIPKGNGQYTAKTVGFIVRGIQTFDNWEGDIVITFCVKEVDKPIVKKLRLKVSDIEGTDQIPFLEIEDK